MTRKQQRLFYTALLIGGGFYVWSQYGPQIAAWFSGIFGGSGGGGGSTEPPDEEAGSIFGTLADVLESLGGLDLSGVFDGLFDGTITIDVPDNIIPPINPPSIPPVNPPETPSGDDSWFDIALPEWLGGVPVGGAVLGVNPGVIAQILAPLYVGTSDALNETLHDINMAIPGDNTGLEMGNRTLMSAYGPFILKPDGSCFNLAGKPIACPAVVGVEDHTIDYYTAMETAA